MGSIVPAILPASRKDLDEALARLAPLSQVTTLQIDIVDGQFAKPPTWPYAGNAPWELPLSERFRYDLDLMVQSPELSAPSWITLGASRITLHIESMHDPKTFISDFKKKYGHEAGFTPNLLSIGLALNISTPVASIEPFLKDIDYVQCMGIGTIGRQGEPFDERVIEKIRSIRQLDAVIDVQIDGGVSLTTAPKLIAVGATRLIVGSALLHAKDITAEFAKFEQIAEQYGIYE